MQMNAKCKLRRNRGILGGSNAYGEGIDMAGVDQSVNYSITLESLQC